MDLRKLLGKLKDGSGDAGADSGISDGDLNIDAPPAAPAGPPPRLAGLESSQDGLRGSTSGVAGLNMQNYYGNPPAGMDTHKAGLVQNEVNDAVYNMRAEQIARIEAIFSEFGPSICSYMLTQSLMPGGTKRLVEKLEQTSRGREGADLALVATWITKNGVPAFCKKVGIRNVSAADIPRPSRTDVAKPAEGDAPIAPQGESINEESTQLQGGAFPFGELPAAAPAESPPPAPAPATQSGRGFMFAPKPKSPGG